MDYRIGMMQGRLTEPKGRGIQFFPFDNWKNEFFVAKNIGLDEIEFIFDYEDYKNNPIWSDNGISEIRDIIRESGVVINAVCFDYFMRRPFYKYSGEEQKSIRKENTEIINRILASMERIGIGLIEIPAVDNSSLKNELEKSLFCEWIFNVAKSYSNIKFGLETDMPPMDFRFFIESVGLPNVGANYDSGNSSGIGYDPFEEVTTLRDSIFNIHIKDRKYMGTTMKLGTGSADFESLFCALKEIRYERSFILQAARGDDGDEAKNIAEQVDFLKEYINRYCDFIRHALAIKNSLHIGAGDKVLEYF